MTTNLGRIVYVRYQDHIQFQGANPKLYSSPWTLEVVGFIDFEDDHVLRLVMEKGHSKTNGLVILKSTIIERKLLA